MRTAGDEFSCTPYLDRHKYADCIVKFESGIEKFCNHQPQ